MKTPDLKPCPFCGGKPTIIEHSLTSEGQETIMIGCINCGARLEATKMYLMIEKVNECGQKIIANSGVVISSGAVERWNRRVSDEKP